MKELKSLWENEKIALKINTEKDDLENVIEFIKEEYEDFGFDEGMMKSFANEKGELRIYIENEELAMDVYEGLPSYTWKQFQENKKERKKWKRKNLTVF